MNTKLAVRLARVTGGAFAIALLLGGAAKAITDTVFTYSTAKTGYLMVPPAALVPDAGNNVDWSNISDYALQGTSSTIVCLNAPVNLPQGAKLTALAVWYARAETIGFVSYSLVRRRLAQQTGNTIANLNAPAGASNLMSANTNITDATVQTVDNRLYIYWLHMCLRQGGTFYGARIAYTYTNAGD